MSVTLQRVSSNLAAQSSRPSTTIFKYNMSVLNTRSEVELWKSTDFEGCGV